MEENCKTCRFWKSKHDPISPREGRCRRHAPDAHHSAHAAFPTIRDSEWCGEYQRQSAAEPLVERAPGEIARLVKMAQEASAVYDAMSPEEKAAHDKAQRESFVRGMMPTGDPRLD